MEQDRRTIGLTAENQQALSFIEDLDWFADGQDIARFAMAYAIKHGLSDGSVSGTDTRWAAGNFDDTGEIRALLAALYPECGTPVRLMEYLVNKGLEMIEQRLRDGHDGPSELME